jgi:hypothetical protein
MHLFPQIWRKQNHNIYTDCICKWVDNIFLKILHNSLRYGFAWLVEAVKQKVLFSIISTSTSYDAPSIVMTMHRREQAIYFQLINKQKRERKKVTYLHIHVYKMENCLDVVGLDLWFKLIQRRSRDNIRW